MAVASRPWLARHILFDDEEDRAMGDKGPKAAEKKRKQQEAKKSGKKK
ncbi:MAG: hypothetical protein IRY83_01495 [Chloroflexi bacterium]|nr:hypothetical protein [Chloroflexota bacterium]